MPFEDVTLVTSDGVKLNGWYVPAPEPRCTLLFFHGNAGNISHRLFHEAFRGNEAALISQNGLYPQIQIHHAAGLRTRAPFDNARTINL
jgi:hypothetical protein